MEFRGGPLASNLAALGLTPADIDLVCYSHLHADHVGWTTEAQTGALTFGRARHVMARVEWEHWQPRADIGGPTGNDLAALDGPDRVARR